MRTLWVRVACGASDGGWGDGRGYKQSMAQEHSVLDVK